MMDSQCIQLVTLQEDQQNDKQASKVSLVNPASNKDQQDFKISNGSDAEEIEDSHLIIQGGSCVEKDDKVEYNEEEEDEEDDEEVSSEMSQQQDNIDSDAPPVRHAFRKPFFVGSSSYMFRHPRRRNRILQSGNLAPIKESGPVQLPPSMVSQSELFAAHQSAYAHSIMSQSKLRKLSQLAMAGDHLYNGGLPGMAEGRQEGMRNSGTRDANENMLGGDNQYIPPRRSQKHKRKQDFDSVAVSFWLAELQIGSQVIKLNSFGGTGRLRTFVAKVERSGQVILRWRRRTLFGWSIHTVELKGTEVINEDHLEFKMKLKDREILARAPNLDTFKLWTTGMVFIFLYATHFSQRLKLQLLSPKKEA